MKIFQLVNLVYFLMNNIKDEYDFYGNASDFLKNTAAKIWADYLDDNGSKLSVFH